ncbi:LegC family aminotransferase [Clostridium sartagoforme]|uniref:LegC family aminotransferase n=1 Tax=Clostridium sartagoforme TaxID=84031 RepID=A0A4S2DJS9_9CLOT|nr:LegC family aminotransferase [Clostridium sartagoforme]TGY42459.1 LegC family aminotransferase [Clostridium sartagoforme]
MIPLCIPEIRGNEWKYIKECLDTNWVSSVGKFVDRFEEEFAKYNEVKSAVVTMNGTAALQLALVALGVGEGDEVIVPSMTFISSVNAIKYVGAIPVFVDVDRETFVMDVNKVEELITEKTKAIMPVHIYGYPVEMDELNGIAKKYNLFVIEDATEALGTLYKGKLAGTLGDVGCFSFNGNKLITTGAGGMLITNNEELGKKAKYLSNQTKTITENGAMYHEEVGYNFRMPNILAAMGVAQLEKVDEYLEVKRRNARLYNDLLKGVKGITLTKEVDYVDNCYWLYSILVEDDFRMSRDELLNVLKEIGIQARPFFLPVHAMKPYSGSKCGDMNVTIDVSNRGINLPSSVSLTEEEVRIICDVIKNK